MAQLVKTYIWDSNAESWVFQSGSKFTGVWQSTGGNTGGCITCSIAGRNAAETTSYWYLQGTWEAMGVPAGATVTGVQLTNVDTKMVSYNVVDSYSLGPFEVRSVDGATLYDTLWAGRIPTGVESSWTSSSGTNQAVPTAIQASNSSFRLRFDMAGDLGNNSQAIAAHLSDNLQLTITYTVAPTVRNVTTAQAITLNGTSDGIDRKVNVAETVALSLNTTATIDRKINVATSQAITSYGVSDELWVQSAGTIYNVTTNQSILVSSLADGLKGKLNVTETCNIVSLTTGEVYQNSITNGTFDVDTTGWTASLATISVENGRLKVVNTGGGRGTGYQTFSAKAGRYYKWVVQGFRGTGANDAEFSIGTTLTGTQILSYQTIPDGQTRYGLVLCTSDAIWYVKNSVQTTTIGDNSYIDNVEVLEVELGQNLIPSASSNFDTDGSAWWSIGSGTKAWNPAGYLEVTEDVSAPHWYTYKYPGTVVGKYYKFSLRVRSSNGSYTGNVTVDLGSAVRTLTGVTTEWQTFSGVLQATGTIFRFEPSSDVVGAVTEWDDITLQEIGNFVDLNVLKNVAETSALVLNTASDGLDRLVNINTVNAITSYGVSDELWVEAGATKNVTTVQSIISATLSDGLTRKINITSNQSIVVTTQGTQVKSKVNITETSSMVLNTVSLVNVKKAIAGTCVIVFATAPPALLAVLNFTTTNVLSTQTSATLINKKSASITVNAIIDTGHTTVLSSSGLITGTNWDSAFSSDSYSRMGNRITPSAPRNVGGTSFYISNVIGSYQDIDWLSEIWEVLYGTWELTTLVATSNTKKCSGIGWFEFQLPSEITLNTGTTYAIVLRRADGSFGANRISMPYSSSDWSTGELAYAGTWNSAGIMTAGWETEWAIRLHVSVGASLNVKKNITTSQSISSQTSSVGLTRKINIFSLGEKELIISADDRDFDGGVTNWNAIDTGGLTTSQSYSPSYSFIISNIMGNAGQWLDAGLYTNVENDKYYNISFWCKATGNTIIVVTDSELGGNEVQFNINNNTEWTFYSVNLLYGGTNYIAIKSLQLYTTIYIDDVSIKQLSHELSVNISGVLTRKVNVTCTASIQSNISAIQSRNIPITETSAFTLTTIAPELFYTTGKQISTTQNVVLATSSALSRAIPLTTNQAITCNTITTQVKSKINVIETSALVLSTVAIQKRKINVTTTQAVTSVTNGTINRKISIAENCTLSLSTTATELFYTIDKQVSSSQSITSTASAVLSKHVPVVTSQTITATTIATQLKGKLSATETSNIVLATTAVQKRKVNVTSSQGIVSVTAGTQVKSNVRVVETISLVLSTAAIITTKKNVVVTSNIVSTNSAIITKKVNVSTTQSIVSSTSAILINKINISTSNAFVLSTTATLGLYTHVTTTQNIVLSTTATSLFIIGSWTISISIVSNSEGKLGLRIPATTAQNIISSTVGTQVKSKVNIAITQSIVSNISSIIKRKINIETISQIVSNTVGLIYRKFSAISTNIITTNISAILKRHVNDSITSGINSATTAILTKKVNITTNQSVVLDTTAVLSIPGLISVHSSIVSNTSAILSKKVNITESSSIVATTSCTVNKKTNVSTNQSFVLSTTATRVLGKRSAITTQSSVINTIGLINRKFNASIGIALTLNTTAALTVKRSVSTSNELSIITSSVLTVLNDTSVLSNIISETQAVLLVKKNVASLVEIVSNTQGQTLFNKVNLITSNNIITSFEAALHSITNAQLSCNITTEFSASLDFSISETFGGKELFFNLYINNKFNFNLEITPYEVENDLILNSEILIDLSGIGY